MKMSDLVRELAPLDRVPCSTDYDRAVDLVRRHRPFDVHRIPATREHNGWRIPPKCDVVRAEIRVDGEVIWDATEHPLRRIALTAPFRGVVSADELRAHLHRHAEDPGVVPMHFRQQFRTWDRDWGFCVPGALADGLGPGPYEVVIETAEAPGYLTILTSEVEGRLGRVIALCANLDHPGVANDGPSGVAVGIRLLEELEARDTRFTYRLVLLPGIIGSEYYLGTIAEPGRIVEGVGLQMLGSDTPLRLQKSRAGTSQLDDALERAMTEEGVDGDVGDFESAFINDEYIWEGYGVPMSSLTRFPYPEYHTDRDGPDIIREEALEESLAVLLGAVDEIEASPILEKRFTGNVCLSHPAYDLYVDPGQVVFGDTASERRRGLRRLMALIPMAPDGRTIRQLAREAGVSEEAALEYLEAWAAKGLVELR